VEGIGGSHQSPCGVVIMHLIARREVYLHTKCYLELHGGEIKDHWDEPLRNVVRLVMRW